jgi:hypothetical protein
MASGYSMQYSRQQRKGSNAHKLMDRLSAHSSSPAACHPRTMLLTVLLGRSNRSSSGRLVSGEQGAWPAAAWRANQPARQQ